ncbi:extracellular catalytic domain type 1 short-chain-length polyhydroxyalkanoate depolymerase [Rhizobium rhizophilum]|uniref:PHB depolymerase family esterase n=1 Tax=Rhizobium rhizophilum TaxID=1850373 RepID=A0ABY2QU61_9HYPH|nr:PHB depolymerase family esterase [Rhizobium rhizophilum]THV13987.1 PHB depolymerase family esterase [Rhizobium rhizophilum]
MRFKFSMSPLSAMLRSQKRLSRSLQKAMPKFRLPEAPKVAKPRAPRSVLVQVNAFGSNPGRLRMMEYVPPVRREPQTLVVVLHGCLQTAEDYHRGSGWSRLARDKGLVLLYPEQTRANNRNLCFNWFRPSMVARDRGELMSIRQMIEHSVERHGIARDRIFVQGLSAGGAMGNAMLVTYPDLFAAGQVVGGLPFGAARDAMGALSVMKSGSRRSRQEWGDLARSVGSAEDSTMPAVSIWQGGADRVVSPLNAEALLAQWLDLYGLDEASGSREVRAEGASLIWRDAVGKVLVEYRLLDGLDHGLPVIARHANQKRQPYMLEGAIGAPQQFFEMFIRPRKATAKRTAISSPRSKRRSGQS